jgi:hypothetical protein
LGETILQRNRSNSRIYGHFALAEWLTGEGLSDSSVTESLGFSPSRAAAVDFGDFQMVQEFVDHEFARLRASFATCNIPAAWCSSSLDSINEAFIEKMFGGKLAGNRTKYLELLAGAGILDEFPPAVINMAMYAFTARSCLGYLRKLTADGTDCFTLNYS